MIATRLTLLVTVLLLGSCALESGESSIQCPGFDSGTYRVIDVIGGEDCAVSSIFNVGALHFVEVSGETFTSCGGTPSQVGCHTSVDDVICVIGHGLQSFREYDLTYHPDSNLFEGTVQVGEGTLDEGPRCVTLFDVRLQPTDEFGEPITP